MADMTPNELDVLNEVATIGVGHSSTALSQMLKKDITIDVPQIEIIKKNEIYKIFENNNIVVGIHMQVLEDINGFLLCLFDRHEANNMIDAINNRPYGTTKILDEQGISAIKEAGNIIAGSYLSALADFSEMKLLPSLPHLAFDTVASIFDFIISNFENDNLGFLLMKNKIEIKGMNNCIKGTLVLSLLEDDMKKLIRNLQEKYQK